MINREVYLNLLQGAVESRHQCRATHLDSIAVSEVSSNQTVWQGVVEVFELTGCPHAALCYGWIANPSKTAQQFVFILHKGLITTPQNAVRGWLATRTVTIDPISDKRTLQPQQAFYANPLPEAAAS